MATPKAMPSSPLISDNEAAVPDFSGGTDPTIKSVEKTNKGAKPNVNRALLIIRTIIFTSVSMKLIKTHDNAESDKPMAMTWILEIQRVSIGAKSEPIILPLEKGIIHKPASRGVKPLTICKYCASNNKNPP